MTIYVNHDLRRVDGKTIYMPAYSGSQEGWGNLEIPVVTTANSTPKYPIGTKYVDGDRVFRYCYAGSNIAIPQRGVANASPHLEGTCLGNAVAGAYTLDLPPACADFEATVIYNTKDIYAGGWLWIMGAAAEVTKHEFHRIVSNDALDAGGTYVRVTLETPITTSQATPWITSYRNTYANCQQSYPDIPTTQQTVVCMTTGGLVVTLGQYFWGQTWGPIWTTAMDTTPGAAGRHRQLVFWQGGVIALQHETTPASYSHQHAGYILSSSENTGDMMFMLQLEQ